MESGTPETLNMAVGGGAAGTPAACRWNPTKEQINMLESLYGQGLRTPTAEQIQEITAKLQAYGHIEGKNVFYWFQNHKARQRQKEKQDHLSLFRQYNYNHQHLHRHPPCIHLPPPPNVVFDPCCYMPQNNLGFYDQQHSQVVSPTTSNITIQRRSPRTTKPKSADAVIHRPENAAAVAGGNKKTEQDGNGQKYNHQETLDLFPLHPTGILQERSVDSKSINGSCLPAPPACTSTSNGGAVDRLYFDFFC